MDISLQLEKCQEISKIINKLNRYESKTLYENIIQILFINLETIQVLTGWSKESILAASRLNNLTNKPQPIYFSILRISPQSIPPTKRH